ncbi:hypothetical protein [Streptomyces niveiscabiei]|uniref:Uncharacterized protein n=1 Tax=Streptomyces niveiscabiei TaxID=164115 RepID=A0ABW9HTV8_9ACTN
MLDEATLALAASVGTAVAQAAGTDAWAAFRARLARVLGRGDTERETAQGERLDGTAAAATAGRGEGADMVWRTRVEVLLEELDPGERAVVEGQLGVLMREFADSATRDNDTPGNGTRADDAPSNHTPGNHTRGNHTRGNLFLGDAAIQHGNGNIQVNRFGPRP